MNAFRAMIRRGERQAKIAAALIDGALALPLPRLVLVKGDRKLLLCRNMDEEREAYPIRVTDFDSIGPSGHRTYRTSDRGRGLYTIDHEIISALHGGFRRERRG